jgi:hypothetical protein
MEPEATDVPDRKPGKLMSLLSITDSGARDHILSVDDLCIVSKTKSFLEVADVPLCEAFDILLAKASNITLSGR